MASSVSTRSRSSRLAKPAGAARAALIVVSPKAPPSLTLQKGDLLAIPLCILWGVGLWMSLYGPLALFTPGEGGLGGSTPLSFLWNLPMTAFRFLFGG